MPLGILPHKNNSNLLKLGDSRADVYRILGSPVRRFYDFGFDLGDRQWQIHDARFPFNGAQMLWISFVDNRVTKIFLNGRTGDFLQASSSSNQFLNFKNLSQLAIESSFCLSADGARCNVYRAPRS